MTSIRKIEVLICVLAALSALGLVYFAFHGGNAAIAKSAEAKDSGGHEESHAEDARTEKTDLKAEEADHDHAAHGGESHEDKAVLTPDAIAQNGMKIEPVKKHSIGEILTVPGRISYDAEHMAHVGTPVQGRVAELKVKLGDSVKKGDELLVIDSPAFGEAQSDFLQKRTLVEVAESAEDVARVAGERAKRLLDGKGISLGEFQRRDGEYKSAVGNRKAAKSSLTAAENTLHIYGLSQEQVKRLADTGEVNPKFIVRAPIDGQVVRRETTIGEIVGPDNEILLTLADMNELWVIADVPEKRLTGVAVGSTATVTCDGMKKTTLDGKVAYIAPELDKETRTGQIRIEMQGGVEGVNPGMFTQVHLNLRDGQSKGLDEVIAVPEAAVQTFEGGPTVFVEAPNEPASFLARRVEVGPSNGEVVPILSGLEEGTRIVMEGAFIVKAELVKGEMEGKTCSGH